MYYIGIDIGTSGTKTVLFDRNGQALASASAEYPLAQPALGWAEQAPEDWWQAVKETLAAVTAEAAKQGIAPDEIGGIGLSGQMHGLVMLDEKGDVIRPAIIWCDQRTAKECSEITEKVGAERLIEITANPALTGFTASKILWVKNHEPENYRRCQKILLPKDYIRYKLTGVFAAEVSDAAGMQLLDVPRRQWSAEVLERLGIDGALLAPLYESAEITGRVSAEAAAATGLSAGTPVAGGAGDNAAAAVGTGVVEDGRAFTTIGTSGVVYAHTSRVAIDPKGRVHTFCCAVPGEWLVMGVTQGAGLSLKWFRDQFCGPEKETAALLGKDPYLLLDQMAASVPIGSRKVLYLPYMMGERTPHLDPDARGVFFGLSALHGKKEMLRAVMEGVAFSLKDCQQIIAGMGIPVDDMMACGGGGTSALWRQMLADLYGCPVKTLTSREGPALGAAILAMVGAGEYESVPAACRAIVRTDKVQNPDPAAAEAYQPYYKLYTELYPALKASFKALAEI